MGTFRDGDARLRTPYSASYRWRRDRAGRVSFSSAAVLLLVLFTYSMALTGPNGPWAGDGADDLSLADLEAMLRDGIQQALDAALERAVHAAALADGIDLASALDAAFSSCLPRYLPEEARGWKVDLERARAGLRCSPVPPPGPGLHLAATGPVALVEVSLTAPYFDTARPLRLALVVSGPLSSPNALVARTSSTMAALSDDGGPLAYALRNILWETVQSEVLKGQRGASGSIGPEAVETVFKRVIGDVARGGPPAAPGVPSIDLEALVRQAVEGMLQRNLGWLDEYILGGEVMEWLEELGGLGGLGGLGELGSIRRDLRTLAARRVAEVTIAVLEDAGLGVWAPDREDDLTGTVEAGVDALRGLSDRLQEASAFEGAAARAGREFAQEALTALLGAIPGSLEDGMVEALEGRAAWAFSQVALVVARLGLDCARDALLAIGTCGREVDAGEVGRVDASSSGPRVELGPLNVSTSWSGVVACEPGNLIGPAVRALWEGDGLPEVPMGSMPYRATCLVAVEGTARLVARLGPSAHGDGGGEVVWHVPVDLSVEVPLVSGWPLEGVEYVPSATLAGDLTTVVEAAYGSVGSSFGWLVQRFSDADEWVRTQLLDLAGDMRESLMTESAYTLSQALWSIGDDLVDRKVNDAINRSWDLLMDLFGDDLREALTWEFEVMGIDMRLSVDPAKQQLEVLARRGEVSLLLCVRRLCDPHPPFAARPISGYHWGVFGEARLDTEDGGAVLYLDPLTLEHPSVMTVEARWGDVTNGSGRLLRVEALEARKQRGTTGVSLSQLVGGSALLSMVGGLAVDAGVAVHGDLGEEGAMEEMLSRAVKDAWMATVRGWKVGDLLGGTGRGPDAGAFLETLLRELYFALVERGSGLVEEIEAFVEVDPPDPVWPAVRVSLVVLRPLEVLLPLVEWVRGALPGLVDGAWSGSGGGGSHGGGTGLAAWAAEHVVVRTELSWTVDVPERLRSLAGEAVPDQVGLVLRFSANLASLAALAGRGVGLWEASAEVLLRGLPGVVLAVVPGMGEPHWRWVEVTLLRVRLRETASPMVLLSQVLYDARGKDADLEFVELVNRGDRVLDLEGWCIEDDGGRLVVKGHHPLLPGDHLLVARNGSAVRETWGQRADVDRMRLRLSNEGDHVRLLGPDGSLLDMVAWEGHVPGWEGLDAGEGFALIRAEGSLERCEPSAWTVGVPAPRGSVW